MARGALWAACCATNLHHRHGARLCAVDVGAQLARHRNERARRRRGFAPLARGGEGRLGIGHAHGALLCEGRGRMHHGLVCVRAG